MSTINPFVLGEGSIGWLRPGAVRHLPPPFGGEWTLLVAEGGLRAGVRALLRTFCLREETIWSMCHWASTPHGQPSATLAEFGPPCVTAPQESVSTASSAVRMEPDAPAAHLWFANPSGMRAIGLCAIGSLAVLAWLGIGYLSHQHPKQDTASMLQPELAKGDRISAPPQEPPQATLHSDTRQAAAQEFALAASQPRLVGPNRAHHRLRQTNRALRHTAQPSVTRAVNVRRHAGHAVSSAASHRLAHSYHAHRPLARPSVAGDYSPSAPARLGRDEYASIAMPIDARASHETPAPPVAHRDSVSDTEWMEHISQRRVTEVPDEFSK